MPTPKGFKHKKIGKSSFCAVGSFRRVKSGKTLVTVCCPKGKWSGKSCRVGMRAIGLDKPRGFGDSKEMREVRSSMERIAAKANCARCLRQCGGRR